ncbi:uncharacterized protein STEHIDRAFT_152761 [Stereum hirsutum FP-91666 SS1]|uniref:uncharacterized protein n=1 Tax=Stereum hirsutum (strain FP-91666) TaxID=721885 RepID=UPI000440A67B|nr:uncharacterized protein STEHIDRAFT_152761 [Stereum hirsutum FP-91666 SS1]EIM91087.1 hypothetical protein STEHIDRAFT_152761 [Stereum hirsutum FP-91666 SS1]
MFSTATSTAHPFLPCLAWAQYLFGGKPTDARKEFFDTKLMHVRGEHVLIFFLQRPRRNLDTGPQEIQDRSPWQSVDLVVVKGLSTSSEGSQQTLTRRVRLWFCKRCVPGLGLDLLRLVDIDIDIDLTSEIKHDFDTELQRASRPVPWDSVDLVVVQGLSTSESDPLREANRRY